MQAQQLLYKVWEQTSGMPDTVDWSAHVNDASGNLYVTGNTIAGTELANVLTTVYDRDGDVVWQSEYNGSYDHNDYGTAIAIDNDKNVFVAATTFSTNNTFWEASGLSPLTNYEYEARSMCDGSWSAWVGGSFTTLDPTFACDSPENYNSGGISPTTATISWESVPDALQYRVSYEVTGTDSWFNFKTPDTIAEITGLLPGTNYSWKVITECPYGWTDFLSTQYFNTSPLRMSESGSEGLLEIAPNPASESVIIRWSENSSGILQLIDQTGRVIYEEVLSENQHQTTVDVSNMSPGLYFIKINGGNSFANASLIVE